MGKPGFAVINVRTEVHERLLIFCEERGMLIGKTAERAINELLGRENPNVNPPRARKVKR